MWLNEGGIASIVPLKVMAKLWRITYNSRGGTHPGHFVIHTNMGKVVNKKGMPNIDLNGVDTEVALCFVQTIRGNMEGYTKREVEDARVACEMQGMVGHPLDRDFLGMVHANMIPNFPVIKSAVKNANIIFGLNLAGVRGRTVRRLLESVWTDCVQISWIILEWYKLVMLAVNVIFINNVPFLVRVVQGLNIIKKVEHFGCLGAPAGVFDFANRSGILFKWNDEVDKPPQGLVNDNVIPFPSLEAKIPGVPLTRDQPILTVEDSILA
jgi:hypothetical protein